MELSNYIPKSDIIKYLARPELFAEEVLGLRLWSGMRWIYDSVWHHQRTSVAACHGISKTICSAALAVTFLNLFDGSVVITSAPTHRLVEKLLWKEIGGFYQRDKDRRLIGRILNVGINVSPDWYMVGFSTDRATGLEGFHAPAIFWVLDEAKGLPSWLYDSLEGSLTGGIAKVLEVSTTDGADQMCAFRQHHTTGRARWNCLRLSAYASPFVDAAKFPGCQHYIDERLYDFGKPREGTEWDIALADRIQIATEGWINDRRDEWEQARPDLWQTKVEGGFSRQSEFNIIPTDWIMAAVDATVDDGGPWRFGLDVARMGDDTCVLTPIEGKRVHDQIVWGKVTTMETVRVAREFVAGRGTILLDAIGVGAGVWDRLAELGDPTIGHDSSTASNEPDKYLNFRAELWFHMRQLFQDQYYEGNTLSIPNDPALIEELSGMRFKNTRKGKIQVENKDDYKKRLGRSPDKADSLCYGLYRDIGVKEIFDWADDAVGERNIDSFGRPTDGFGRPRNGQ